MSYLAIFAVVLVLLNTYPLIASQDLLFASKRDSLKSQAAVMASALMELESLSAEQVERVMNMLDSMGLSRIVVTDPAGLILYDSLTDGNQNSDSEEEQPAQEADPGRNTATPCIRRWYWLSAGTMWPTPAMPTRRSSPPPPPPWYTGA